MDAARAKAQAPRRKSGPASARKHAEAVLAGEKRLLELVATGEPLPAVLDALCTFVSAASHGCHCSVLLVEPARATVRHASAPTLPSGLKQAVEGRSVSSPYWGPCAQAIDRQVPVIVDDIEQDHRWTGSEWSRITGAAGLRSCWTTPILSRAGGPLGTFALYQQNVGGPTRAQRDLIARFTHIASIAVERAQAEAELRQSEALLAQAQRLSATGSFIWRPGKNEIIWSEQTYRIYELDPSVPVTFDLVGTRIHPDEASWFQDLLGRASSDGRDLEFEHRLLMPDQSVRYLHVIAQATRDGAGGLEYIGAVREVTDRRRSEDALSKLSADLAHMGRVSTLGALTASIAHEVTQPLTGIITNTGTSLLMLAGDPPDLAGVAENARRTIRDANRASEVLARLRTLFRKTTVASESLDLNEAALEVLALSLRELQRAQVQVRTEMAPDLPTVTGDRVQLQQVVLNLILNAADAMRAVQDRPRQLTIQTGCDAGDCVRLTVTDSGTGFDPGSANRLFDTFYTTKPEGMGIGLSISRSIIERHHGRLWAAPNAGPGATFAFSIPRRPPLERTRKADDPPERRSDRSGTVDVPA